MASLRIRQRKDGSTHTSVLYVLNGRQTSLSFNDHAEAVRFQELANKTSPAKALEVRPAHHDLTSLHRPGSRRVMPPGLGNW